MGNKKFLIFFISVILAVSVFVSIYLSILHWDSIDWNLVSISETRTALSVITNILYLGVLALTKTRHLSLWIIGLAWLLFNTFTLLVIKELIIFG